ncbi:TIR domain-containing protein [Nitrosomonas oligotropha]|uniref:TIR domain-containing protein n=1 Tax=Nitrosomonas oligotropha TaxID=42354 RepID=A0A2T5I3X8_9PROT|nr:toll/interleukin-1 receptor domain-containing protein [Nitrosomonas oligotropha]PTQ78535.1 TIR domain-containing protein [Nitrosomonas oligotropha]
MPDIFISYAHVDNKPFSGLEKGWITHFVTNLQLMINSKIGRAEDYSLWQDFRLQGNTAITPEIETQVKAVQVLLVFLSPGWIASDW